jgi:hypothetical protein
MFAFGRLSSIFLENKNGTPSMSIRPIFLKRTLLSRFINGSYDCDLNIINRFGQLWLIFIN